MILESKPEHDPKSCPTCQSEEFQETLRAVHTGLQRGLLPVLMSLLDFDTGEIHTYTADGIDNKEIIRALIQALDEDVAPALTAIKAGEHGN
jgi:hypothetical protein